MAFYNFSNAGRDFYNPDTGSPIIFFDDSDDDYVYAFIDDDDERQKPVKRRRQAEHKRNSSKRNQRTIARAPASDTESREQLPEKQYSIDLPDITGTWFAPRFDVRETQDNYYLHGELPGVEQEDVDIEFTDPRTIQVRGFVNRAYDDYNSPDNVDETSGSEEESDSIEDEFASVSADSSDAESDASDSSETSHQATVEEVDEDGNIISVKRAKEPGSASRTIYNRNKTEDDKISWTYWLTERSVGTFQRTFQFPRSVDQDNVKANLRNGILNVVVPKETRRQTRKITIE